MTSQEPQTSHDTDPDTPETEIIAVPEAAPVFVDSTGRRSRLLRRVALAFGILLVAYGGLISISLAGGPVSSSAVLPLPGLDDEEGEDKPQPRPSPTPEPTPIITPARQIVESATRGRGEQPRPVTSTSATASVKPTKSARTTPTPSASSSSAPVKPTASVTESQHPEPTPTSSGPVPPSVP
ncbi:hypothetical protein [Actinoplanes subglobosus]|uniref:Uncharacterized protein n=1 Tax=Actinoplanes subglobosus TaxID=1547892 RepID=A0ABV8J087_9ACTN